MTSRKANKLTREAAELLVGTADKIRDYTEELAAAFAAGGAPALRLALTKCATELRQSLAEGMRDLRRGSFR